MLKRVAIGTLTAVVGGSLLLSAGTASAHTKRELAVKIADISPNPVVVKDGRETRVTIEVRTEDATKVELRLRPDTRTFRTQSAVDTDLSKHGDLWRYTARFDDSDYEGRWQAIADAYDRHGKKATDTVNFSVDIEESQLRTRVESFKVSPSAVRKNRNVGVSGRLRALDDHRWQGVEDEEVEIYFRRHGSNTWKYVTSADTGHRGWFSVKTRAKRSGEFRAVYEGTDDYSDATSRTATLRVWR
ncbi:hypothetical protein [Sinosporangium siamense]|uniref:Uncharacterized protein n=1 Tax=Sinosporangium siamense TaxID=1367973 RepID=A0A919V689_9ACTN|nr:hypothetical protein [Sinosporangium siamense]GII93810.1 hypothetical protein Ssi02_40410 [Sinosporangium siamense]